MNKKKLYESIIASVAKEVKKALKENQHISDRVNRNKKWHNADYNLVGTVIPDNILWGAIEKLIKTENLQDLFEENNNVGTILFILYPEYGKELAQNLGIDYENVKWNITNYWASDLAEDFCNYNENELITYNDIINMVEGEDYQEIIDDEGSSIGESVLDEFECPENGQYVYDACVEIAQRLLDGESANDLREELGENEI